MKSALPLVVLIVVVGGCGLFNKKPENINNSAPPPPASPSGTPKPAEPTSTPTVLIILKRAKGKYPAEIKLLENAEMDGRLNKLLGKDFAAMKAHWNVENPIEIESRVFMASGCEAHNCGANHYLLFVDMPTDNINVFHIEDGKTKHYFEKGEIKLPPKFAGELSESGSQ